MKYAVCMTIFGKSQFLYDQIMSILNQAIPPSQLIIIEDYSGISSKNYLEKILFDKKIPYKILVNKTNLGPAESFRQGILLSDYDILYFADHDDVWSCNRVLSTINYHNDNFLVVCNAKVFYENKDTVHSLYKKNDFYNLNIYKLFFKNFVVGATTSINIQGYRNLIKNIRFEPMHDWILVILSILLNKKIKFVDIELVSYRRHSQTLTNQFSNSIFKKIIFRMKILRFIFYTKKLIFLDLIK